MMLAPLRRGAKKIFFDKRLAIGFGLGLGTLLLMAVLTYRNTVRLLDASDWLNHTHEILQVLKDIELGLVDAETGQRGFLLTGEERHLQPYQAAAQRLPGLLTQLDELMVQDPEGEQYAGRVIPLVDRRMKTLAENLELRSLTALGQLRDTRRLNDGKKMMDEIRSFFGEIRLTYARALETRDKRVKRSSRWAMITLLAGNLLSVSIFGLTFYFLRRENWQRQVVNAKLQDSRAELQSLFESLPGLYLVLTPKFEIVAVSNAYLKATMTEREAITGRGLFEVFPDNPNDANADGVSNLRASLNTVLETGAAHTMAIQKYDIRRPDGVFEERYWSPINSPVISADRQISYIVHRVEDVTDFVQQRHQTSSSSSEMQGRMKKMEADIFQSAQKIQLANQQLEHVNRELAAFSYSVSHDLRTPLRTIDGFSQMLVEDYAHLLDAEGQANLQRIRSAAQRMSELIDDMLSLSKLGRVPMVTEPVDLTALARAVMSDLRELHPHREVTVTIADNLRTYGDPRLLRIVLENLLSNAWKYTGKKLHANIEFGALPLKDGKQTFFVKDDGAGFEMKYIDKLFTPFQRLHLDKDFEGTGVGLVTVQRILARHNGTVAAEGAVGQGATFYFTL
jgi:signal transduction histidine kinase/CHASE3 domain sensor protein